MASVQEHYEKHLASIYVWMAGGIDSAIARGRQELEALGLLSGGAGYAVDLGAGFGMHAIPLARSGCRVLAVDTSAILLRQLRVHAEAEAITTVQDDLLNFARHLTAAPDLVLCMGDTLTHLPDTAVVVTLFETVTGHLRPGGEFIITLRDYSIAREGADRFIPVRGDSSRILACFLEYADNTVQVHDILHEFKDDAWSMRVSAYRKLRLSPDWIEAQLKKYGFSVTVGNGPAGMLRFVAVKI